MEYSYTQEHSREGSTLPIMSMGFIWGQEAIDRMLEKDPYAMDM